MQTIILPHPNTMRPFFKETEDTDRRGETPTERKGYKFTPRFVGLMDRLRGNLDAESDTRVLVEAVRMLAKRLPILGELHDGPFETIEDSQIEDWASVGDLIKYREGDYLYRANGPSVTGGAIEENDLVLIRPQDFCDPGDVAVVLLEMATGTRPSLRRVRFLPPSTQVELVSLADEKDIIVVDTEKTPLQICGVQRGIIKES